MAETKSLLVVGSCAPNGAPAGGTHEALGLATELAAESGQRVRALLVADCASHRVPTALQLPGGVEALALGSSDPAAATPDRLAACCRELVERIDAELVVMPHTIATQDLAPRLAGLLGAACGTECRSLSRKGRGWALSRGLHGGAVIGEFALAEGLLVATLDAQCFEFPGLELAPVEAQAPQLTAEAPAPPLRFVERFREEEERVPLEEASRIVSGGRGIGGPEGFEKLAELARTLGAQIGSSRPPCDAGWVSGSRQVGTTGRKVAPELYVAVGISGSPQHLAGMARSRCIVAINSDAQAPIFDYADLGVVGDWREVVGGMLAALSKDAG